MGDDALPTPFFLARPREAPPWPGVVVLMEGMGIHAQLLRVCQRLADEGYAAIAPDLFHRQGGSDPGRLPDQFQALRREDALSDVEQSVAVLHELGATAVGVTGFCMGGRLTYEAALAGLDLRAAAGFYGAGTARLLGEPRCPVLLFFGGQDEYVATSEIEMVRAHHGDNVVVYPDAGHGFMRDGSDSFEPAAARDAWDRLLAFFGQHLC